MKRPFVGVGISFVLGIIISYYLKIDMIVSFSVFFIVVLLFSFYLYKGRKASYLILILFVAMGMLVSSYKLNSSVLINNTGIPITIQGIVDKVISQGKDKNKYIVRVKKIESKGNERYIDEKTVLKVIGNSDIEIGDNLKFRGTFKLPKENTNPKLYNHRKNLVSKNIFTTINIRQGAIYNLDKEDKEFKYKARIWFRNRVEKAFDKHLNGPNSDLVKGIILGDYTYLDQDDLKSYREIGLAHILAVSGLHIGIIAGAIVFFLSQIGVKRKWNVFFTIATIWIYGYLISFPQSILRANIMFSFLFISSLIYEPYDSINSLFLSFWILLLFNPMSIFSVGFQLSYAATFSILYFSPKVKKLFYPYENKSIYTISALLALYIGILPIQAYYFNEFSFISILSNILISPIIFIVLILSGILLVIESIFTPLGVLLGYVINIGLNIQGLIVKFIYENNFLHFNLPSPDIYEIGLYYILIFALLGSFDYSRLKKNIKRTIYYYLVALVLFAFGFEMIDDRVEIDFIDVGQGDSSLIKTRDGNYLVDTGGNMFDGFDICENITLPYLKKHGINKLKGVFITHFHLDHCKGIPLLMENLDIENIFISYKNPQSPIYNDIVSGDIPVILLEEGDRFNLDRNTIVTVLSPNIRSRESGYSENNLSLVFDLSYFNRDILFTGDIEREMERNIEDRIKKVDILKVAHHGSKSSSTEDFLFKTRPSIAIISVGENNFYGHPDIEVIDRFKYLNTEIYRTDNMGMTKVTLDGERLSVASFLNKEDTNENLTELALVLIYYLIAYIFIKIHVVLESELKIIEIQ